MLDILRYVPWIVILLLVVHTLVRIVRRYYKFPIPSFLVRLIDNPMRRWIQPPQQLVKQLDARSGMYILDVGPGSGTYTLAVSKSVGIDGFVVALDIEPVVLRALHTRLSELKVSNVFPLVADVHHLPFNSEIFDAAYLIAVIGEIPAARDAIRAFYDVLKPGGRLMFSELLLDPDFPLPSTLRRWGQAADWEPLSLEGNLLHYTLTFQRPE